MCANKVAFDDEIIRTWLRTTDDVEADVMMLLVLQWNNVIWFLLVYG